MLGNMMIFGDSYSTYEGHNPSGYAIYYSGQFTTPPVITSVENTWWKKLINATNSKLIQNNSWSGSTICYTGYDKVDCSQTSSFIYRFEKLLSEGFFEQNKIDTLLVFGGTNDSWAEAPLGKLKYDNIEKNDLYCVLPAISYFAKILKNALVNTRIVFIGNCDIKNEITDAFEKVCKHFNIEYIALSNIDKISGHPTELGMAQVFEQVLEKLNEK